MHMVLIWAAQNRARRFDKDLTQVWQKRVPTLKNDYQALLNVLKHSILEADNDLGCKGKIGIGVPGIVNAKKNCIYYQRACCQI